MSNTTLKPIDRQSLADLKERIMKEMGAGLKEPNQPLRMLHSYIDHVPTGREQGNFITIDFGGTNLRVMHVHLKGTRTMTCSGQKWSIPDSIKRDCLARDLFSWIADKVLLVQEGSKSVSFNSSIGFCFSFPLHQHSLNSAILLQWNKGFDIPECIGQDIAVMLNSAFMAKESTFRVGAIVNDTVAVLLARSYESRHCVIGAVLGTGFNAAYWESWGNVPKLAPDSYAAKMSTIINTEMGGLPLSTEETIDKLLDDRSENPGLQLLEKRVSGMYLGRMFQIACELNNLHFSDYSTKEMSMIEENQRDGWELAEAITTRSVQYAAASIAAIYERLMLGKRAGLLQLEVAMEGTVIEKYYRYKERLEEHLKMFFGINDLSIAIVDDYSAIGAGIAACIGDTSQ